MRFFNKSWGYIMLKIASKSDILFSLNIFFKIIILSKYKRICFLGKKNKIYLF